jgi:hypothetical protein
MKKGQRHPDHHSLRLPWTCERCKETFPRGWGRGTHMKWCGVSPDDLLWERIDKNHPSGCWVYSGATDRRGYGRPAKRTGNNPRQRYYAHRRSYEIHKGPIPKGRLVLHTCHNPPCCNPDHLYLGDDKANHYDKIRLGRHGGAVLDEGKVREIKRLLLTPIMKKDIAARYGVKPALVSSINTGKLWGWVKL